MAMSDNLPTNVQLDANANGTVSFATEVVATIAGLAATEVDGVACMFGATGLADILSRRMTSGKNLTKGVRVDVQDGKVTVDVTFVVEYGSPVPEVAKNIQENVKKAIETMSGLMVEAVDVHVQGVSFERENRSVAEIEQQQRVLLQRQQEGEREERLKSDPVASLKKEDKAAPEEEQETEAYGDDASEETEGEPYEAEAAYQDGEADGDEETDGQAADGEETAEEPSDGDASPDA